MIFRQWPLQILILSLAATPSMGGTISASPEQKILIVGDSHLGGAYGQKLYQLLSSNPMTGNVQRQVSLYSACGSTSTDWAIFDPAKQRNAPCGLSIAPPYASLKAPLKRIPGEVVWQNVNGRRIKRFIQPKMPLLPDLLIGKDFTQLSELNTSPDILIVSLGTNMIGSIPSNLPDTEEAFQTFYRSQVQAYRKYSTGIFSDLNQIFAIQTKSALYASCIWVGPPACDHLANQSPCFPRVKILNRTMAQALRGRCAYVDSLKLTRYPKPAATNSHMDGYHFQSTDGNAAVNLELSNIAEKWAIGVTRFIMSQKILSK